MENLSCSIEGRPFQALLVSLGKKNFHGDKQINSDALATHYLSVDIEQASMQYEIASLEEVLRIAGRESWKPSKLEKLLSQSALSEKNKHIFVSYWTNEHEKIIQSLVKNCTWNNHFHHLSWRLDIHTDSKRRGNVNEPVALFELGTVPGHIASMQDAQDNITKVKFEVNREQLTGFLGNLENIQKKMEDFSN